MQSPEERIQIMERSLRCFAFGLLGLLPGLGAGFAALALWLFFGIRIQSADDWNPASAYLNWGFGLGVWGLFQNIFLLSWLIIGLSA